MPDEYSGPICERCKQKFYYDIGDPNMSSSLCLSCWYDGKISDTLSYHSITEGEENPSK